MQERSGERITKSDLRRLGAIAVADLESLFSRKPQLGHLYRHRLLLIALCQGAALHYVDGRNGVKDFDVWAFFRAQPDRPFPYRRNAKADFGSPKFGTSPGFGALVGRRVDLLGRSLPILYGQSPVNALREYLSARRTTTARALAAKAVVVVCPEKLLGCLVWPAC